MKQNKQYAWKGEMDTALSIFKKNKVELGVIGITYKDKLIMFLEQGCRSLSDVISLYASKEGMKSHTYGGEVYNTRSTKRKLIRADQNSGIYVWNGTIYSTIAELVRDNDDVRTKGHYIDLSAVGCASTKDRHIYMRGYSVEWNGEVYKNLTPISKKLKFSATKVASLLRKGINTDSLLKSHEGKVPSSRKGMPFKWNGVTYADKFAAAEGIGVTVETIAYRKSKGYESDGCLSNCTRYGIQVKFKGRKYRTIGEAIKKNVHKYNSNFIRVNSTQMEHNDITKCKR